MKNVFFSLTGFYGNPAWTHAGETLVLNPFGCWTKLMEQENSYWPKFFPQDCQPDSDPAFGSGHGQRDLPIGFQMQTELYVSLLFCILAFPIM